MKKMWNIGNDHDGEGVYQSEDGYVLRFEEDRNQWILYAPDDHEVDGDISLEVLSNEMGLEILPRPKAPKPLMM